MESYRDQYEHPIWQKYLAEGIKGGHDGMDWLEFSAFFEALDKGEPMPIDVYDAASWMSVTLLSENSLAQGGLPQSMPDFTRGLWINRQ